MGKITRFYRKLQGHKPIKQQCDYKKWSHAAYPMPDLYPIEKDHTSEEEQKNPLIEQIDKELKRYQELPDSLKIYKNREEKEKDYKLEELKKKCSIEFNDNVPDSIKEKILLYCYKKGIYNLKSWDQLIQREGKPKIAKELTNIVKDDPEFNKWSVEAFFKDSLELCIRKDDGTLKNWVVDEALKQSILDE